MEALGKNLVRSSYQSGFLLKTAERGIEWQKYFVGMMTMEATCRSYTTRWTNRMKT